jgi:hypothetical protein
MADAIHHGANARYRRLEIIAKLVTVLEVEPAEFAGSRLSQRRYGAPLRSRASPI